MGRRGSALALTGALLIAGALSGGPAIACPRTPPFLALVAPASVPQGSPAALRIRPAGKQALPELTVRYNGLDVPFVACAPGRPQDRTAFLAVPADAKPGRTGVRVRYRFRKSWCAHEVRFRVIARDFPVERLTVEPKLATPSEEDQRRIIEEAKETNAIYQSPERALLAADGFTTPVKSRVTSVFGRKRIFNEKTESFHSGVDLRANEATLVRAAAAGVVRLSKSLFFAGNAVILDHGLGVFTSYSHLSRVDVTPGQKVGKGQIIGKAGSTGRVTGPHLHWGMKVQGISIDPLTFEPLFAHACGGKAPRALPAKGKRGNRRK